MITARETKRPTTFADGVYKPSEAIEVMSSIFDGQIKLYKQQYLKQWERNHSTSSAFYRSRIEELSRKRKELLEVIETARQKGCEIALSGILEICLIQ